MTLLSVENLSRSYGKLRALDGVVLTVDEGARHALIGCNGAGKTTLLHLLAGTIRASGGRIHYRGKNITRLNPARRARLGIARSFQTPAVFDSLTAFDNLTVAATPHLGGAPWRLASRAAQARDRAEEQIELLGIADCAPRLAGELSHGQRRLVEIGMALVSRPRLLLLDEPAAGLTDTDMERLLDALRQLPTELAVVLVEHHQDLVTEIADSVTVLHEGQILAEGSPEEIAADPQVAEAYLGTGVTP